MVKIFEDLSALGVMDCEDTFADALIDLIIAVIRWLDITMVPARKYRLQLMEMLQDFHPVRKTHGAKRGRKKDPAIKKRNNKWYKIWNTGRYTKIADLARELNENYDTVRKGIQAGKRASEKEQNC